MAVNGIHSGRLIELSNVISENTKKIDQYFAINNLPKLSFAADAPLDFPVSNAIKEIQDARRLVVNATQELHDLMVGPREMVRWMSWSFLDNLSLQGVHSFDIAKHVPLDREASYADIATRTGQDETNIRRLIRHAITNRVFCEPREGFVAHTAASIVFIKDQQMVDWNGLNNEEIFGSASKAVKAMRDHPGSQEPTETGYSLYHCPGQPMFAYLSKDPKRAKRFGNAMSSFTGGEGYELEYLIDNYPWRELDEKGGLIVDVGGSFGFVCIALAQRYPNLRFVVQDLPKMIDSAPSQCPPELLSRIEFQSHDFYTPQPVHGADLYFFRWILHNQSDKYGVKMMQQLIPALKPGAKIVINDNCLPKPGAADYPDPWDEKITRSMDLIMLSLLNAKERDDDDWFNLFKQADPRFKYLGHNQPQGSRMSIMEAVWDP